MTRGSPTHVVAMTAPLDADADARVRRFYWTKRLALAVLVACTLLVASWFTWSSHEQSLLSAEVKRWRDAHLPLSLADLQPPPIPDAQNGATLLLTATATLKDDPAYDNFYYVGSEFRYDVPQDWSPDVVEVLTRTLAKDEQAMAAFHVAAQAKAARWPPDEARAYEHGEHLDQRDLFRLLELKTLHARLALLRHDTFTYLDDVADLSAVHRLAACNPSLFGRRVAITADDDASMLLLYHLGRVTLAGPENEAARQRALALLRQLASDDTDPVTDALVPLEREGAGVFERLNAAQPVEDEILPPSTARTYAFRLLRPVAVSRALEALPLLRAEVLRLRTTPGAILGPLWSGSPPARRAKGIEPAESIARDLWPEFSTGGYWLRQPFDAALRRRFAPLVLAMKLYAADHDGAAPDTLDPLVPHYLPAIPIDPFDKSAAPIAYTGGTTPRPYLYSFGLEGARPTGTAHFTPRFDDLQICPGSAKYVWTASTRPAKF